MGQPKGSTGNPHGRPAGSKNVRTAQWEALAESIVTTHSKKFNEHLDDLWAGDIQKRDRAAELFLQVVEYFKPKQARTVHAGDETAPIHIHIHNDL